MTCGDGKCEGAETCLSCAPDCGKCESCGNKKCSGADGETCFTCPDDCGTCEGCGDGKCNGTETCASCAADCGVCSVCGNGKCESTEFETCTNCPADCGDCELLTCLKIVTCAIGCIKLNQNPPEFSVTCVANCVSKGCADVQFFVPPDERGAGADGRLLVLVLDNVNVPPELAWRVRSLAGKFVDRMTPADEMAVIMLHGGGALTSRSPRELRAAIRRYAPSWGAETMLPQHRATQGLEAIASLSQRLADATHRRKALVFIGDTHMFSPNELSPFDDPETPGLRRDPDLSPRWLDAMRATANSNVSVFAIDPHGARGPGLDAASELRTTAGSGVAAGDYAEGFAEHSGGRAYARTNNFDRAIGEVWRDSGSYYLIGYAAPNDGKRHAIGKGEGPLTKKLRARFREVVSGKVIPED